MEFLVVPQSKSPIVGDSYSVGASVSGTSVGTFTNKPLPSSTLEIATNMHSVGSDLYVGVGQTTDQDAILYKSTDYGDNWDTYFTDVSGTGRVQGINNVGSDMYFSSSNGVLEGITRIFKNGSLKQTLTAGVAYCCMTFDNGNVSFGVGDYAGAGGRIYTSTNGGTSFVLAFTGVSATQGRMHAWTKINGTTALCIDLLGYVYRTTNSGVSWSQISQAGTDPFGIRAIGVLVDGSVIVSSAVGWCRSTNGGVSFSGMSPLQTPPFQAYTIKTINGVTSIGEAVGRRVAITGDGGVTSWGVYEIPDTLINTVRDTHIIGEYIFASTGFSAGEGRVYRASFGTDFKLYKTPSTLIDNKTETDGTYSYSDTADLSDYGSYYLTATNAGTTITSGTFTINPLDIKPMANYDGIPYLF